MLNEEDIVEKIISILSWIMLGFSSIMLVFLGCWIYYMITK